MKLRVTTLPPFTSLISPEHQKAAKGNLVDLPWCFDKTVGAGAENLDPKQWAKAVAKAPGKEVVVDCERTAYSYIDPADGQRKAYFMGTASYVGDPSGVIAALRKWSLVLAACAATKKDVSLYSYPSMPGPKGVEGYAVEDVAFLRAESMLLSPYATPWITPYVQADIADFHVTLKSQMDRSAAAGYLPRFALLAAFYQRTEKQGPEKSFVGADVIYEMAKTCRDLGIPSVGFFNPQYPAAMDAIARAAVEL
jgi:hypothetical protein